MRTDGPLQTEATERRQGPERRLRSEYYSTDGVVLVRQVCELHFLPDHMLVVVHVPLLARDGHALAIIGPRYAVVDQRIFRSLDRLAVVSRQYEWSK